MQVIKRDGSLESFQQEKIARVAAAAGVEKTDAQALASRVSAWVYRAAQDGKIASSELRDKVLEEMEEINPYAAGLFRWYQKTKIS